MVGGKARVCALGALVVAAGCSTGSSSDPASRVNGGDADRPAPPQVPDLAPLDGNRNRIDDSIDTELLAGRDATVAVEAVFGAPMPDTAVAEFEAAGGTIRHILHHIGYGFTGRIPRSALAALVPKLGSDLVLMKQEQPVVMHLDESTRTSRARAVWAAGFAGSASGFNGSAKVNIGIVDSGVDSTHPDLAGRMLGYKDFTSEAVVAPKDMLGHGTHVAGIALGSGAAFGIGPGTLQVTEVANAGDPNDPLLADQYYSFPYHLPPSFNISGTATFEGTATKLSFHRANDGSLTYTELGTTTALASPLPFDFTNTAAAGTHFTLGLHQNALKDVKRFQIAAKITNYPAVGDGFPAMRGVAPLSGYYAAKIFPADGLADTGTVTAALDEIDAVHESLDIKVINCSWGAGDSSLRAKVATLASHGIVVVASAGNTAITGGTTLLPGLAPAALAVGATSDVNLVARYSTGRTRVAGDTEAEEKPDLVAPGGSLYRSKVLAPDTNWTDSEGSPVIPDVQKDDYTSMMGTSMAAPIVAGGAALVIQGLESKGHVWDYKTNKSSMLVKMLLLATATETNQLRESNFANPVLGRAPAPKDSTEGYGIVNIDAAIEAATLTWDFKDPIVGTTTGSASDRRAWARKVKVPAGQTIKLTLTSPATADFDVHVYQSTPAANGAPQLQAWSAKAGLGVADETTWTFLGATDLYVVVKRIEGSGSFTLSGATFTCGNGTLETGEECDDKNTDNGDCCSGACQLEAIACVTPPDAGVPDTGAPDAGDDDDDVVDASTPPPDAAIVGDASPPPPPSATSTSTTTPPVATTPTPTSPAPAPAAEPGGESGCATSSSPTAGYGGLGLALVCGLVLRRRRRS